MMSVPHLFLLLRVFLFPFLCVLLFTDFLEYFFFFVFLRGRREPPFFTFGTSENLHNLPKSLSTLESIVFNPPNSNKYFSFSSVTFFNSYVLPCADSRYDSPIANMFSLFKHATV